jgi:CRP-like cAMP-binding protein
MAMVTTSSVPTCANRLLTALPVGDYAHISSLLTARPLAHRQRLQRRDEPLREVYFPGRSISSLIITMDDGSAAEIAMVGSEGVIGIEALTDVSAAACDVTVQVAGDGLGYAMNIDAFHQALEQRPAFQSRVTKYARAFAGSLMQSVACHGLHSAHARCCRWLLQAQDRLGTSELPITHELMATLLGVRRPTVTLIMADLMHSGIASTSRGMTRIVDRAALEAQSCECYKTAKALFDNASGPHEEATQAILHEVSA